MRPTPGIVAVALLGIAAPLMTIAWGLQASAAHDLSRARAVQQREVAEVDASPPTIEENRRILRTLRRSIVIRKRVDSRLSQIEDIVVYLDIRGRRSAAASRRSSRNLEGIASTTGGAARAARNSSNRLQNLATRLDDSARLAMLIAEELEELDHKLGPTVGSRR
jgi:hypothetical protein